MIDVLDDRQLNFLKYCFDPESETYRNALQSGLRAGYSQEYSENITHLMPKWLSESIGTTDVEVSEIIAGIKAETVGEKATDRLKAWELLGKYKKMFTDRVEHTGDSGGPIFIINKKPMEEIKPEEVQTPNEETTVPVEGAVA
jgi:hypothetical protein